MFPAYTSESTTSNTLITSTTPITPSTPTTPTSSPNPLITSTTPTIPTSTSIRHGHSRKLSHVQFGKRPYIHDEYTTSSSLMIPFDELHPKTTHKNHYSFSSIITTTKNPPVSSLIEKNNSNVRQKKNGHWLLSFKYWGPFSKGENWPLFTYLMVAFTIIIFSGEILLSNQSSGEFFELEPFNYMLGPSMEIMIQVGARFAPCMRHVDSMPPEERYVCLHTIAEKNKTPTAAAAAAAVAAMGKNKNVTTGGGQNLLLLDPVVNLADPRLLNSSCSLSSICGMTTFHQNQVPDQTYRLLTPLFIHTGLVHLIINLAVLIKLGAKVERIINSLRFSGKFYI